ncbi:MAG: branched-chain amino acid ABC transporter permease, partial [Nitrososphaerales archaeon]
AIDIPSLAIAYFSVFGIFSILAISLNLEYGYGGQPNFGQVLFYGVGAFTAGIVSAILVRVFTGLSAGGDICSTSYGIQRNAVFVTSGPLTISIWFIAVVAAIGVGAFAGLVAAYPALRVKEEWYLGMVLLVGGELFRIVARNTNPYFCSFNGLAGIREPFAFLDLTHSPVVSTGLYTILIIALAIGCYFIAERISSSPFGRLLKSVRDDRVAAEAMGKDIDKVRRQVLVIGSAMAGLAGALYVFFIGVAIADDYISGVTFLLFVMIVLGGIGNNKGVFVGVALLTLLQRGTQILGIQLQSIYPGFDSNLLVYLSYMVEAAILLFLLIYRPKGVIPEGRVKTKAYTLFDFGGASKTEQPDE